VKDVLRVLAVFREVCEGAQVNDKGPRNLS
jgi:hypothetical protein